MPSPQHLAVWMNGHRVGTWSQNRGGTHVFHYDAGWTTSPAGRALSLSLPFTPGNVPHRGATVANYFENLLPDSDTIRQRIRTRYRVASNDSFDLLAAIGRDCVGAVQLLPDDHAPEHVRTIQADKLDAAGVERVIGSTLSTGRILGQSDDDAFRISIAGAQEKTALLFHDGDWWLPRGSTPTTHILKLPLGLVGNLQADMKESVENEWLCARIVQAFGLETATCEIARFGAQKVLVVERFDRASQPGGWIARLPQEDFCQALGVSPHSKYESDGGPGIDSILRVLAASAVADVDRRNFAKAQMVFWLLAATDGHAKNFSIFHERGGAFRMAPLYDILSAWPVIGTGKGKLAYQKARLAMAVRGKNSHWKLTEIKPRHWNGVAKAAGLKDASALIEELITQTPRAISAVGADLPHGFPAKISDSIFEGLERHARLLAND